MDMNPLGYLRFRAPFLLGGRGDELYDRGLNPS